MEENLELTIYNLVRVVRDVCTGRTTETTVEAASALLAAGVTETLPALEDFLLVLEGAHPNNLAEAGLLAKEELDTLGDP